MTETKQYKYGTFSAPSYISIGDPYVKKEKKVGCEARAGNGRQFQTQPQKRGQTVDNWGGKRSGWFKPLYESNPLGHKEKYFNPGQREIIEANAQRKKCLTENRFRYANPMKKSAAVGDNFGTFDKLTYKEPFEPVKPGDPPRSVKSVPPNIKCNPAKKGSYGNNWGKLLGPEFPYMPEPMADKAKQITAERLEHYAKMGDRNPFKASFPPTHMRPPKVFEWIATPADTKTAVAQQDTDRKPFYPSKVPRKGYNSTINKFPEHMMDNFEDVLKAQRAAAAAERAKLEARGAFKASMRAKSLPVIPVMTHPLNVHQSANMSLPPGTSATFATPDAA